MKRSIRVSFIVLLSSLSFAAWSQDMSAMKKMTQQQMMAPCNDKAFLSCIGISKNKCTSSTKKSISSCDHLYPKDMVSMGMNDGAAMNVFGECFSKGILKHTGISTDKLDACDSTASAPPMDMEQGLAMMGKMFQAHAEAVGTDGVTLPVYKNATVTSHFANGEMSSMMEGVKPIPALKMESPDNIGTIASYYRGKLKGFREYKIQDGILFMKNGPKDFDVVRDMKTYLTTPHVEIMPIPDVPKASDGPKSSIQIAYKK